MSMDHAVLELASSQYGLVSASQLRDLGCSPQAFSKRVAGPNWVALTDEVMRHLGASGGRGAVALAAVLDSGPGAVLSHSSAASWWGLTTCELTPLHVTRTSRTSRRPAVDRLHVVRVLPAELVTVLDSVPIVRPELLALQLFAQYRQDKAERLVDALWSLRLLSGGSILALLDRLGRRGRNGTAGLRRYAECRGPSYVPPASGLEGRARRILRDAGIPMRHEVDSGGDRWVGRVDLRHEHLPLIVEVQSDRYHAALSDRRSDAARVAQLEGAGFVVVEVWEDQVWHRPWEVVAKVRDGIASVLRNQPGGRSSGEQNEGAEI